VSARQFASTIWATLVSVILVTGATAGASEVADRAAGSPAGTSPADHRDTHTASSECKTICKIECSEPFATCSESEKVIETLKVLADAYARGDLTTYETYLDDGCTTFDEETKKLIVGKQAVLEHLKQRFQEFAPDGKKPLVSYTIEHPYANVTGDTAVVTFVAGVQIGGKNPYRAENHVTDIFVKHGDKWKKLHYRGRWRKVG